MTLVRFNPLNSKRTADPFNLLHQRISRAFDDILDNENGSPMANWSPRVEVTEFNDKIEIIAELPGIEKENVNVELSDNVLTISGEKSYNEERKERNVYVNERLFGSFRRSFNLPTNVDAKNINAEFRNGILTINVAKAEEAKPRQITIQSN